MNKAVTIKEIEGIVISQTNYSESSKILNVFTKEEGIIGLMSKGSRKLKSKLRVYSNPLVYAKFQIYYKKNALSTLIDADIIDPFMNILTDLKKQSYSQFILELFKQVYKQNNDDSLFELLIVSLKKINEGYDPRTISQILQIKLLDYLGVSLCLDCCSKCSSTTEIVTISVDHSGFLCTNCYQGERKFDEKTFKLIRLYYYVDIAKISKIEIKDDILNEIDEFLDSYYDKYTGIYLMSKSLLHQI